jgi:hypothetical protein
MPIHQRQHMWFMHGGAPPHFLHTVTQHLNQTLREQWIGRGGPVNWPAPSPALILLDFWLWKHLYSLVYSAPINELRGITATSIECLSGDFQQFSTECAPLCDEELNVVLKCMGVTWNIRCRDHTNIAHISVRVGFWTYVGWDYLLI